MSGPACVVFDPTLTDYDFGPDHPMSPIRVDLTVMLARELGVLRPAAGGAGLVTVAAPMASDELVATVHDPAFMDAVRPAGKDPYLVIEERGLGTPDNPTFEGMHEASAHVVGATVEAARRVWTGEVLHAANISGGLHHAMPDKASGFCVYNDVAVGIRWLLDHGAERVAYVDVDVHHGDGVEKVFYDDPRVLTISLHETGQMLFPGTGFPSDTGGPGAEGSAVNVALPPGTSDAGWLRAFHAVVPPLVRRVRAGRAGHPARLRLAHRGPPGAPDAHRRRAARGVPRAARPGARGLRGQVGGHRGRRLRGRRRGPPVLDAPARDRGRHTARPATETPEGWREHVQHLLGRTGPLPDDGRSDPGVP